MLCALLATAIAAGVALAAAGDLDHSFSQDGKKTFKFQGATYDAADDVAVDARGRIVITGHTVFDTPGYAIGVARLNPNGSFDHSFGGNGRRTFSFPGGGNAEASSIAFDQRGRIVIAGSFQPTGGTYRVAVARLNQNGSLDRSFSGDGRRTFTLPGAYEDFGTDVVVDAEERIAVAVEHSFGDGPKYAFGVARIKPNGSLDRSFSGDGMLTFRFPGNVGFDTANGIAVRHDGRIVLVGNTNSGAGADFAIAELTRSGGLDGDFSGDGRLAINTATSGSMNDGANGVVLDRRGRIVAVGTSLQTTEDFELVRVLSSGGLDHSFSHDGKLAIDQGDYGGTAPDLGNGVTIDPAGRIVVGGFSAEGGVAGNEFAVARVRPGGSLDTSFSGDGTRTFGFATSGMALEQQRGSVAIDKRGRIVLGGVSAVGAGTVYAVARLRGS